MRLSLAIPTVPRNASNLDKDALLQNAFIDLSKSQTSFLVKRAGYTERATPGNAVTNKGIFYNPNNNTLYYINDSNNPISV